MVSAYRMTAVAAALVALSTASSAERIRAPQVMSQATVQPTDVPVENPNSGAQLPAATFNGREVEEILGKEVRSSANEDMGRIINVLVDRNGQTLAAVIDFGGFLGIGSRKIAVDWSTLKFTPTDDGRHHITLELTRDQVKAAPEYKEGKSVVVLGALGNAWRSSNAAPPEW